MQNQRNSTLSNVVLKKFWEKAVHTEQIIQEGGAAVNAPDAGAVGVSGEDSASATTTADLVHELTAAWEPCGTHSRGKGATSNTVLLNELPRHQH